MNHCYVKIELVDEERFIALTHIIQELIIEDSSELKRSDSEWENLFDESALKSFWWPSEDERKEWEITWFGTPYQERHKIPPTRWHFGSLIETLLNNEWMLIGTRKLTNNEAVIEFSPHAYPFGGTDCLVALAEAFGHRGIEHNDGTGVQPCIPVREYWQPSKKPA